MTIIVKVRQYYTMQTINVVLGCYSGVEGRPVAEDIIYFGHIWAGYSLKAPSLQSNFLGTMKFYANCQKQEATNNPTQLQCLWVTTMADMAGYPPKVQ